MDGAFDPRLCNERHDAVCRILHLHMEKVSVRLDSMDRALEKAERDMERRLEGLNELRGDVVRDRDWFVRREAYEIKTTYYDEWMHRVNDRLTKIETRTVVWTGAVALFLIVIEIALHFIQ